MKKIIYISAITLGLGFVSCQKQDVTPNAQELEAPSWESVTNGGENERGGVPSTPDVPTSTNGDGKGSGVEITDPNMDPDAD